MESVINPGSAPSGKPWFYLIGGFVAGAAIFFLIGQNYGKPLKSSDPFEGHRGMVVGKVIAVDPAAVKLEVNAVGFGLGVMQYTARVDQNTKVEKTVWSKAAAAGQDNPFTAKPLSTSSVSFSEVKVGDTVVASSARDFSGKTEFNASKIEIRVYQ